ncbi:MAG TPA: sigma-54-dependent Fis family transcriptional regulator [Polyangiaceae bacterium]|nr:sigma-54-dependent Fis family transcriptional regulator [Polyangiaceae bacterium]
MTHEDSARTIERLTLERDFYAGLVRLGGQEEVEPFLEHALALATRTARAGRGYLALFDPEGPDDTPRWSRACGFSGAELADVRSSISRGIIAEALATGGTVQTSSAVTDPRFQDLKSVRRNRLEAVLCTPIGAAPPIGVLYLQGTALGAFETEDQNRVAAFADHLAPLARQVLERSVQARLEDPTRPYRERLELSGLIGRSEALGRLFSQVACIAPLDVDVLLTGPTGAGKTLVARCLWRNSARAARPFVEINCAALPEPLLESELFGASAGAHSTAMRAVPGKLAEANGGTVLLDEITELPLGAQAKLLQLLQSRKYYPLGSNHAVEVDLRVIAATNVDLRQAVADRRFREDLLYRLEVIPMRVPGLTERLEDLPALASFFARTAATRHGLPELKLSPGAARALQTAEWPGNVRQLEHLVQAALIRAVGDAANEISPRHLFPEAPGVHAGRRVRTFQEATREFQSDFLRRELSAQGWNVAETARSLDLARSHLYSLIRAFGLERSGG